MSYGFTLIELLVVITIIVVLLALLTPALDRAIYQAELAVCAAKQKSVATSVTVYAASNKRRYPHRILVERSAPKATFIYNGDQNRDDRILLRTFLDINDAFTDPMCDEVNFDITFSDTTCEVSYPLWFGYRFKDTEHAGRGMYKIGDRFTFVEPGPPAIVHRFNLLISDQHVIAEENVFGHASHPDAEGNMHMTAVQDVSYIDGQYNGVDLLTVTTSRWDTNDGKLPGTFDFNYAADDGSVERFNGVHFDSDSRVRDADGHQLVAVDQNNNGDDGIPSSQYIPGKR